MQTSNSIIAIVGNVTTNPKAHEAAEQLGRELAKAGFRILVYGSDSAYLEAPVVKGYVGSQVAKNGSIQVRYPLHGQKPSFPEQQTHAKVFDFRPDSSPNWEISFYQSLSEVQGMILMGGGQSTMIAGLVAMGHRIAILALAAFDGTASEVWKALRSGRDLPTYEEISLMASPDWSPEFAADAIRVLQGQIERAAEQEKQRRIEELRNETS